MNGKKTKAPQFASAEVPLYYQLCTLLREKIVSGVYAPGDQIPTEAGLVSEYGVSRITVRQALAALEEEDLIRREAGRGTFVTDRRPVTHTLRMNGSLEDLITMGRETEVRLLELATLTATPEDARLLEVEVGSKLMQSTRLRFFHDQPYSYIVNRLPIELGGRLTQDDWQSGSILSALERDLGLRLGNAQQTVTATLSDAALAGLLEIRIGAPLLRVDRLIHAEDGRPLEKVKTYYRSDIYSLSVQMTRTPSHSAEAELEAGWALRHNLK